MPMLPIDELVPRYLSMQRLLQERPATIGDLARESGCRYESARRWVNAFVKHEAIEFVGYAKRRSPKGTFPSLYRWIA